VGAEVGAAVLHQALLDDTAANGQGGVMSSVVHNPLSPPYLKGERLHPLWATLKSK
jgi:hypothetical protein